METILLKFSPQAKLQPTRPLFSSLKTDPEILDALNRKQNVAKNQMVRDENPTTANEKKGDKKYSRPFDFLTTTAGTTGKLDYQVEPLSSITDPSGILSEWPDR